MVEIAHAVPAVARIFIAAKCNLGSLFVSPCQCFSIVIITADVGRIHLVGYALIFLYGEVCPTCQIATVVDYNVGNGAYSFALECLDHRAQLGFVAKRAVVIAEPVEVVVSH